MNTLKRLTTTLVATVDRTITSMEDHEAVIAAAIRDSRKATARARFKLNKLKADNHGLQQRIHAVQLEADKWQQRAISLNEANRDDAINCIAHRRRCIDQIQSLTLRLEQQQKLELRSSTAVQRLADKADSLNSKRTQLSSRAAAADATRVINRLEGDDGIEIDDTLDRWEQSVFETEAVSGVGLDSFDEYSSADDLPERLAQQEQQQELMQELDALVATNASSSDVKSDAEGGVQ